MAGTFVVVFSSMYCWIAGIDLTQIVAANGGLGFLSIPNKIPEHSGLQAC